MDVRADCTTTFCYLDHAAAGVYTDQQIANFSSNLLERKYGNPHSHNAVGTYTNDAIDDVRMRILQFFGTTSKCHSVIFTSGATAALKLVAETFHFNDGKFFYLNDNHTSVIGMREVIECRGAYSSSFNEAEFHSLKYPETSLGQCNRNVKCHSRNNLIAFPAQSNFCGRKYPFIEWCKYIKQKDNAESSASSSDDWFVVLDAASFVSTSALDLSFCEADFIPVSFYKMFGFPTGIGALIVRNDAIDTLRKIYFGGGTVKVAITDERFHAFFDDVSARFEDGTVPYQLIVALRYGFDAIEGYSGGIQGITKHTFSLAQRVYRELLSMRYSNGKSVVQIYCDGDFSTQDTQGPIIALNLMRPDGNFIGFSEVDHLAQSWGIQFRTGCFCNLGDCAKHLGLTTDQIHENFKAGRVCGDNNDIINGRPTGCIRISFGHTSTDQDVDLFLTFIRECFLNKFRSTSLVPAFSSPSSKTEHSPSPKLIKICLFPIKSCAAYEVLNWEIGPKGLLYDRNWAIVNNEGVLLSQKREPRLVLIRPKIDLQRQQLVLSYPGLEDVTLPIKGESAENQMTDKSSRCNEFTKICGDKLKTYDEGDDIGTWLDRALLRTGCRLKRQSDFVPRYPKSYEANTTAKLSLANQAQFLLISRGSVAYLHDLIERDDPCLKYDIRNLEDRFRANLIIDEAVPFAEDSWQSLRISENVDFQVTGSCNRCNMICIDQETGQLTSEPLVTLTDYRGTGRATFGIHLQHVPGKLSTNFSISTGELISLT